jgi:hypothetical protein
VATRLFADEELQRLREFPDISREELFRYFTLTPADLAFVDPGRGRGPADRLGLSVALCALPWLGFVPDKVSAAPPVAVARLAEQLRVDPAEIGAYGRRAKTRTEHVRLLDALLATDVSIGMSRLRWLSTGPVEASAKAVKAEVDKLGFLRGLGADTLDMSVLPAERRRFLAMMGRRLTPQALERRDPQRRYPILLTVLAQSATDVLDEVVQLFDQAISAKFSTAEKRMQAALAERGKAGEDRQALLDDLLAILTDPQIADEDVGGLIRGERIGLERLRAAGAQAKPRLPRDHGHLAELDSSYSYLRQFTPHVLSTVRFSGGTAATELLIAVDILRELNATGCRKVPEEAPAGFVPTKWRGYLDSARKSGSATAYRHYWGIVRAAVPAGRAAIRGRVRARIAPLRRSGRLPSHQRPVGAPTRRILPSGRQIRRSRTRPGSSDRQVA